MESFRKTLKKRLALAGIYNGMVVLFVILGYILGKRFELSDIAVGFASGFFVGIQIVMISYMRKYQAALKDDEKLKALYISENDERSKFIESKIGGTGISIVLGGMALGAIVAAFFSQTVFLTLLSVLLFSLLVIITLKFHYNRAV